MICANVVFLHDKGNKEYFFTELKFCNQKIITAKINLFQKMYAAYMSNVNKHLG